MTREAAIVYHQFQVTMSHEREERASDSRFVQSVTRIAYDGPCAELVVPDGRWDVVVFRSRGKATVLLTGATTRPLTSVNNPGDELLSITFKPGVYMPAHAPVEMRDRAILLPNPSPRVLALGTDRFELPTFENADDFVGKLAKAGAFAYDELVASFFSGDPRAASVRSLERHFLRATGLTYSFHRQILRAQRAVELLRQGREAVDVAFETGFTDQSHMTNNLKAIMGRTPGQIAREG